MKDAVDVREMLAALDATELRIKAIASSAAETAEQLALAPVCSDKKLKALAGEYLSNVRTVQETLKDHAYVLDIQQDQAEGKRVADATAQKRSELEHRLSELERERESESD